MSNFVTFRIIWDLEIRINSLSIYVRVWEFFGKMTVQILQEEESTSSGGRSIKSFGGSSRVVDQQNSRGSRWRILVIKIQGSCNNQKRESFIV